jgi:FKBP-type peptidyl-prolyl cis-trans isomerase FklB
MRNKRALNLKMCMCIPLVLILAGLVVSFAGDSQAAEKQKQPEGKAIPAATVSGIRLSFKRDPRLVDPTRGLGPWVSGPGYGGATGQDTVEVRAEGVDAAGKPAKISPQWVPSDPGMVTVSPREGDDVKITVHKAGESKLKITYQGLSKELEVRAEYVNKFMLLEIEEAKAVKPAAPAATAAPPTPKTKNDVSYAAGMNLAKALEEQSVQVDVDLLMQGVKDTLSGGKTLMTSEEALAVLEGLEIDQRDVEAGLNRKAVAEKNKREGEAFLAANKAKEGVVTLPSGLQYKIIKAGHGKTPTASDVVSVRYRGTFINGKEFDNTFERQAPVSFPAKAPIKGWTEALQLMPEGSRWQLFVPSDLAYGERGAGGGHGGRRAGGLRPQTVGPNATLIFEVELLAVEEPGAKTATSRSTDEKSALTPEIIEMLKKSFQGDTQTEKKPEKNP